MDDNSFTLYLEFANPTYRYELIGIDKVYKDLLTSVHIANRNLNYRHGIYILEDTIQRTNAGVTMTVTVEDSDISEIKSGNHFRGIALQMLKIDPSYGHYRVGKRLFNYVLM